MGRNLIRDCRDIFEAANSTTLAESSTRKISPPPWMDDRHPLWPIVAEQDLLYDGATVVWGALATANDLLFDPGPDDSLAAVVYCAGIEYDESPGVLRNVADATRSLSASDEHPEIRAFAAFFDNKDARALKVSVPSPLCGGVPLYYGMVIVPRKHLPDGVLTQNLLPLVVNPAKTAAVAILPSRYWSPEMLDYWTDY